MPEPSLNPESLLAAALQHHQAGRLPEAEALYRQILQVNPHHGDALHMLGVLAGQARQYDAAVNLIRQALALQPQNAAAYGNLAVFLREQGAFDEAAAACRQAIALAPGRPEAYFNLGHVLAGQGRLQEAIAAYRRSLELQPGQAQAYVNLGVLFRKAGQADEALAAFRQAIALQSGSAAAYCNLGDALSDKKQFDEAIAAYQHAIALQPTYVPAHCNLGLALNARGRFDEAIAAFRQALTLDPNRYEACNNLGNALCAQRRSEEALAAFQRGLALRPASAGIHNNYGETLMDLHRVDEALAAFRQALTLQPDLAPARRNLAYALKECGLLDEALAEYRHAAALEPDNPAARNHLIFTMHFHAGSDTPAIVEELRRWNQHYARPLARFRQPHANPPDPHRPLRVGYVSPDFFNQAESFFTVPLLEHHDRRQFEIHCYSSVARPDFVTERLQHAAGVWHDVREKTDEQLAAQIRADGIDILVDLTMHMPDNRLLTFARQPAPVQVTWLAYPGSTGLDAMDYRISDWHLDPAGIDESVCTERTVRLPDCWCCYDPLAASPADKALRLPAGGPLTLGCLNNPCKINEPLLHLWARVLQALPEAHLLIRTMSFAHRQRISDALARDAINPARLEFVGIGTRFEHMQLHHRIDVALDTLPYNGITTTCDALWMGTPVVSLVGHTAPGRAGKSLLTCLGLPELVCHTPDEFVQATQALCRDQSRLRHLQQTLRQRTEASPLMDAPRFAQNMEAAYRRMWQQWCARS